MKLNSFTLSSALLLLSHQAMTAAVTYRIYATREGLIGHTTANGHVITSTDRFVALPSGTALNSNNGYTYTVTIRNPANGRVASNVPVWDKGPWNLTDNYWHNPRVSKFANIAVGTPAASVQYANRTTAEDGHVPSNPAGIDLAEGTWADLAMSDNGYVDVTFNWESRKTTCDFNGDGKTDVSLFRRTDRTWYINGMANIAWGDPNSADIPVPGDYNGDGKADAAIFRPSEAKWYINGSPTVTWGNTNSADIPVPGDYNGDGKTDCAIYRPSEARWYINGVANVTWGNPNSTDIPVPGDYNGDGKTDCAIFRRTEGRWYINGVGNVNWGDANSADIPVPGDYNGDGKTDCAIFRPSEAKWYINGVANVAWGNPNSADIVVPGDYNGDGKTDCAIFRPAEGKWFVNGMTAVAWGDANSTNDVYAPLPFAIGRVFYPTIYH